MRTSVHPPIVLEERVPGCSCIFEMWSDKRSVPTKHSVRGGVLIELSVKDSCQPPSLIADVGDIGGPHEI